MQLESDQIAKPKAQLRHNVHVLDTSIVTNLVRLEASLINHSKAPVTQHASVPNEQPQQVFASQKLEQLRYPMPLVRKVLSLFAKGRNVLVIPEAVLYELYGKKENLPYTISSEDAIVAMQPPDNQEENFREKQPRLTRYALRLWKIKQREQILACYLIPRASK